ncbi:Transmembrane protein 246 [Trichoplax sp. H2]|uniref:Uncharacterized protein n=1 Tax=Trichoplax adhaerens TaxID=10228 RepID=B3RIK0_TRIAD|nr:hypothetical protein TRIADDRAFT_51346 [Trichoplax adhaerens]EDV29243.1 hypothetical protein TRIADDRAFT_51346 [Trichoplax adhaerens]RDD41756.1 Transmembrane protein 246 [Trichoplax sp. H2]|eukprot:XP_002108445.1 hypothetical protein TRIADDRAFT_51346 [Trichoplax adhaerens]
MVSSTQQTYALRRYMISVLAIASLVFFVTFLVIMPLTCRNLSFSYYYKKHELNNYINKKLHQNEARAHKANEQLQQFIQNIGPDRLKEEFNKRLHQPHQQFCFGLVSTGRKYNPKYLTQVVARLIPQIYKDTSTTLIIYNANSPPKINRDAVQLSKYLPIVTRSSSKNQQYNDGTASKESVDYLYILKKCIQTNARYIIILEDDALPTTDFIENLHYIIHKTLPTDSLSRSTWAFIKLYYPEKWQGWGNPEVPELIITSGQLATVFAIVWNILSWKNIFLRGYRRIFLSWLIFIIVLCYAILFLALLGRQHLIELRKLSRSFYTLVPAPECCTPAIIYPLDKAILLADYLANNSLERPIDFIIDDFIKKNKLEKFLILPNLVSHIGLISSLSHKSYSPNPYNYDFIFDP